MNKRLTTAVVIMIVTFALCLVSAGATCIIADRVCSTVKQLQSGAADAHTLELFEDKWEKYEKFLSFYTRHSEIENISGSVHVLGTLLQEDEQLFRIECSKIIAAVQHLRKTEMPYLRNIF